MGKAFLHKWVHRVFKCEFGLLYSLVMGDVMVELSYRSICQIVFSVVTCYLGSIGFTGDITKRLCTAAEIKFYFNSFFVSSGDSSFLKPNKNCNLTIWVSGCEPGWACSVGQDQQVDLGNSQDIPARTQNCESCCEGFFCPQGLTCMIRKFLRIL